MWWWIIVHKGTLYAQKAGQSAILALYGDLRTRRVVCASWHTA